MIGTPQNFAGVIRIFLGLINMAIVIAAALALLAFFWGLVKFIANAAEPKAQEEGKNLMKWGITALFVMISFLGIIGFFYNDIGFSKQFGLPLLPTPKEKK